MANTSFFILLCPGFLTLDPLPLTLGPQYGAAKAWKMPKAALEFHANSFASLHNAIRCDYFRRPVDEPLSDHLSIRETGAAQTLMAISLICHWGLFFIGFSFAVFSLLFLNHILLPIVWEVQMKLAWMNGSVSLTSESLHEFVSSVSIRRLRREGIIISRDDGLARSLRIVSQAIGSLALWWWVLYQQAADVHPAGCPRKHNQASYVCHKGGQCGALKTKFLNYDHPGDARIALTCQWATLM